ncbi:MAG: hypothetical protein BWY56_02389 [Acidobacteria bacterium ADurb.Bin340]|nr:MAG: hypothetical protein BWY56_02389 [Acidobacteria bacterium ADurb.Bin340]
MTTAEPQSLEGIVITAEDPAGLVALTTAKPLDLFTTPGTVESLLAAVRVEALRDFTPDLTTEKGRKAIASRAFWVIRTKTFLDSIGKEEVARLKELPRLVDAGRKALRDGLDALGDEIRKDLTEWENTRAAWKGALDRIQNLPATLFNADASILEREIGTLRDLPTDPEHWEEMAQKAASVKAATLPTLEDMLDKRRRWEADQAELARLREAEEARKKAEQEEALRKEGEARALAAQQAPAPTVATPLPLETADALRRGETVPAFLPAPPPADDLEHRRAFNREALADLIEALVLANIFTPDAEGRQAAETTAKAVLTAIVTSKVRHVRMDY